MTVTRSPSSPSRSIPPKLAFLGVRACEIAALAVQDRVLMGGEYIDDDYMVRRANALVVAVKCTTSASTCFCTSMGTGPEVTEGYDLVADRARRGLRGRAGTPAGRARPGPPPAPGREQRRAVRRSGHGCRGARPDGGPVPTDGLHDRLLAQLDSPRWAQIAERCLAVRNCTMVCPTCFCSSVVQRSDLDGDMPASERGWDICFTRGLREGGRRHLPQPRRGTATASG